MKNPFFTLLIILGMAAFSCKKVHNNPTADLSLIQHKWMLVSHNGEALRYVGTPDDYYNFSIDNFLYMYVGKTYDTMAYTLLPDNKTLSLYPVINGVRTSVATNYTIKMLDNHQFVLGTNFNMVVSVLDSLKR